AFPREKARVDSGHEANGKRLATPPPGSVGRMSLSPLPIPFGGQWKHVVSRRLVGAREIPLEAASGDAERLGRVLQAIGQVQQIRPLLARFSDTDQVGVAELVQLFAMVV